MAKKCVTLFGKNMGHFLWLSFRRKTPDYHSTYASSPSLLGFLNNCQLFQLLKNTLSIIQLIPYAAREWAWLKQILEKYQIQIIQRSGFLRMTITDHKKKNDQNCIEEPITILF